MMLIENKYNIGDIVFLITDQDQLKRIVTGIYIKNSGLSYALSCAENETFHYDFEITKDKVVA